MAIEIKLALSQICTALKEVKRGKNERSSRNNMGLFRWNVDDKGYLYPFMHSNSLLIRGTKKAMEENFAVS